uniref:DUF342 domain-containing protein n=1 Tax=Ningiella ruwaisensis TaxID=2364274 RepID=UPI00109F0866|nr:FapA family protein [Ningiella ruwaisensis]
MSGVSFSVNSASNELIVTVDPLLFDGTCDENTLRQELESTEHAHFSLDAQKITMLAKAIKQAQDTGEVDPISQSISPSNASNSKTADMHAGHHENGSGELEGIKIDIATDQMSVSMSITANPSVAPPAYGDVKQLLISKGIKRGISKKRIQNLLSQAIETDAGKTLSDVIAKGLPPRDGRPSKIVPLVPNALDRILRPQEKDGDKVDMRNLGDILCVTANSPVAKRVSPSKGREGFSVSGRKIQANKGNWEAIKLGKNTRIAPHDENLILSELAGQPKFENNVMTIDDTFVTKGVNVGTGNINYEGAVIVNGDVTENMQIIAKGDITINGFVESAFIKSGGDIIITQGATGKMNDEDCRLIADGSIFLQHGQGLDINVKKDLNVKRQLAYSRITCKGEIYVGDIEKPMGNLFASKITAYKGIRAGSIGAVSGSALEIDYSEGFNVLTERLNAINDILDELVSKNADHEVILSKINARKIPRSLKKKLKQLDSTIDKERQLLNWLRKIQSDLAIAKKDYETNARIIANKEMFPGLVVRLNKRIFRAQKETLKSRVLLVDGNWEYQPIIER